MVLTAEQQRELYQSVKSLADKSEELSDFKVFKLVSALQCIEIMYETLSYCMHDNGGAWSY